MTNQLRDAFVRYIGTKTKWYHGEVLQAFDQAVKDCNFGSDSLLREPVVVPVRPAPAPVQTPVIQEKTIHGEETTFVRLPEAKPEPNPIPQSAHDYPDAEAIPKGRSYRGVELRAEMEPEDEESRIRQEELRRVTEEARKKDVILPPAEGPDLTPKEAEERQKTEEAEAVKRENERKMAAVRAAKGKGKTDEKSQSVASL